MSKKLYVGNVSFDATEDDLSQLFGAFGPVEEVKVITDRDSGRSRGFAFVTLANVADADKAIIDLNGKEVGGRKLMVNEARERASGGGGGGYKGNRNHGGGGGYSH